MKQMTRLARALHAQVFARLGGRSSRFARALAATLIALFVHVEVAQAMPPSEWVNGHLMLFPPGDHISGDIRGILNSAVEGPGQRNWGPRARVAIVSLHGMPGGFHHAGVDEVIRFIRNAFPGFAKAEARVLIVCWGNVGDHPISAAIAREFGDVFAANGPIKAAEFHQRMPSIYTNETVGAARVPTNEAWALVRQDGTSAPVSDAEVHRVAFQGESAPVHERLAAAEGPFGRPGAMEASARLGGEVQFTPEDVARMQQEWRTNSAAATERRLAQLRAERAARAGRATPPPSTPPPEPGGFVGGSSTQSGRVGRLRSFVRWAASTAAEIARALPETVARLGVGLAGGLIVGVPVELAVTQLTGNRHLGFAAGYAAGTFGGMAAEVLVFGATWGEAAAGAFSTVSLAAAPAAIAAHLIGGMLADLEGPIASGDRQAIELALELTEGYGIGFFTYGARAWWNDPGGTAGGIWGMLSGR